LAFTINKTLNVSVLVWITKYDLTYFVTRNSAFHEIWLHFNALCTQTQKPTITVVFSFKM